MHRFLNLCQDCSQSEAKMAPDGHEFDTIVAVLCQIFDHYDDFEPGEA